MPLFRRLGLAAAAVLVLSAPAAAQAPTWAEAVPVLRVGVLAGVNQAYATVQMEPFRLYLADRLGIAVEIVTAIDYPALISGQTNAGIQAAFLSATAFATASVACDACVQPLVIPTGQDGSTGYRAIMVARAGGPIVDLDDLARQRLAVSQDDSIAGRLLPLRLFADAGMGEDRFTLVERDSPGAAVSAMLAGEADAALAWSTLAGSAATGYSAGVLTQMVAAGTLAMNQIQIVWRSPEIPNGPLSVQASLPEDLKTALRNAMVELRTADPAAFVAADRADGRGFRPVDAAAFAPLIAVVRPPD